MRRFLAKPLLVSHKVLGPWLSKGLRILLFHDVPSEHFPAMAQLVSKLVHEGHVVDPTQAAAILRGEIGLSGQSYLLSFDDGFASNFHVAQEILDPLGVKAVFFVCPHLVNMDKLQQREAIALNIFDGKRPCGGLTLMGWEQLEALTMEGHLVASHSLLHRRLTTLAQSELEDHVGSAADCLRRRLGVRTDWFAYTFGDVDSVTSAILGTIGRYHTFCRSGVRGVNTTSTHPLALRADSIDLAGGQTWVDLCVRGGLDWKYRGARRCLDTMAG